MAVGTASGTSKTVRIVIKKLLLQAELVLTEISRDDH